MNNDKPNLEIAEKDTSVEVPYTKNELKIIWKNVIDEEIKS